MVLLRGTNAHVLNIEGDVEKCVYLDKPLDMYCFVSNVCPICDVWDPLHPLKLCQQVGG